MVNPLTGRSRDLPSILNVRDVTMKHSMVNWETNWETNCYKALIVVTRRGEEDTQRTHDIQVFDSETGEWSNPSEAADIVSAHEFAKGRLIKHHGGNGEPPFYAKNVESYTNFKDRLFVLRKDTYGPASDVPPSRPSPMYYIREYDVEYHPQHPPRWLEVEIHRCNPFERVPSVSSHYKLRLLASNGFLLVFAAIDERETFESDRGWIYDLAGRTWLDLPKLPGDVVWMNDDNICEIRWNAHP